MLVGETVSHYRVLELLGAGGMGVVYKAEDTRLKRQVALKFLSSEIVRDTEAKNRLVEEARAASALDHPNICTIHEIDETPDGRLFLAMAYYEGETLKERIARGPLAIDEALKIIIQVGRAVTVAHEAHIVHRDIKPANIALTRRGEVKLLDFGVAKLSGRTALTRTGTTLGTIAYMAPEQMTGVADHRADIWALGVVLYEMIAGRQPFTGDHDVAVMHAVTSDHPRPLDEVRPETPSEIAAIVDRALQKDPAARWASAADFVRVAEDVAARQSKPWDVAPSPPTTQIAKPRARGMLLAATVGLVLVSSAASWLAYRNVRARRARQALPELAALIQSERPTEAFRLMRQIEPDLSDDPEFTKLRNNFLLPISIRTSPAGADVYMKPYKEASAEWDHLGTAPIDTRLPLGYFRWRVTKPGFTTFEGAAGGGAPLEFELAPTGTVPSRMVRIPGGTIALADGGSLTLPAFFIDTFELTNREFKRFVDAGGYRDRQYWTEALASDGLMSFEEVVASFVDTTGRPGPATWDLGTYPDGEDDFPVRGVSWYEAAAFAKFARKSLPTVHHWRKAAAVGIFSDIVQLSNFSGKGPAKVGSYHGIGPYGTYDMAGNVKEWCINAIGNQRYILGAAWNEPVYQYSAADARLPSDRSPNNGFRLMRQVDGSSAIVPAAALEPVARLIRDYGRERPASDELFTAYRSLYSYDRSDLKPVIESVDDSAPSWRRERITYAAAYGGERIIAHLFEPRNAKPPFQVVVYFPHSGGFSLRAFEQAEMSYLGFIVKAGRALLFPMYKGMYERRVPSGSTSPGPSAMRDSVVAEIKDLERSVDYLQTRSDIDVNRMAYFGVSYGARLAPIALAVEKRFKTAVIWSGGFPTTPTLPEIDSINFAPRVTTPILMLNGRDDFTFPVRSAQIPMFYLLGTPDQNKRHVLYDGGHVFPFARIEKDTLDWLDAYLDVPR